MPTTRVTLTNAYQAVSTKTCSINIESGVVQTTNQLSQPNSDAPVMETLPTGTSRVIKVKSGETLYASASVGSKAIITYTEA